MTYAENLNLLVKRLADCAESARDLMRNHADNMEPWMWHRTEHIIAETDEARLAFTAHCKEVER